MKLKPSHEQSISSTAGIATILMALLAITVITACSPKSSTEESAAQSKALVDQAVAQAKKEMINDQAVEKAKQDAAVAQAKKELVAEQHVAAAKAKSKKSSSEPTRTTPIDCANCGVVLSVTEVEAEGQGSGLGVVAGGVVGGLLGNQVGNGTGRDVATFAGVVGGAMAGNKIEKNAKRTKGFDVTVKMDTGEKRIVHQATAPNVVSGDAVKIENGVIVKR